MVGADDEAYDAVKPVFKQWASLVVHAGEPGAGTRMKLARNMLTLHRVRRRVRGVEAGRGGGHQPAGARQGGAPQRRAERRRRARSWSATTRNRSQPDHFLYDMFVHTRGLAEKDLSLALALGEATGVDLPLAEIALRDLAAGLGVPHTLRRTKE